MRRWLVPALGFTSVAFYLLHVVVGGVLWPGYSHLSQPISDLTATGAPHRSLVVGFTTVYAVCSLAFAAGALGLMVPRRQPLLTGGLSLLLGLHMVSALYGFFPEDLPGSAPTVAGAMHIVVTALVVPFTIVAPWLVGLGWMRTGGARWFGRWSLATGPAIFVLGGLTAAAMATGFPWFGLVERLNIGTLMAWTLAFSVALVRNPFPDRTPVALVRRAVPDDAAALLAYMADLLAEEGLPLPLESDEFNVSLEEERALIAKAATSETELFLVAEAEGQIVGLLNGSTGSRRALAHDFTFGITVRKEYRNRGVGRALMAELVRWAEVCPPVRSLHLSVWKSNRRALALYRSFGFRTWGTRRYSTFRYGRFQPIVHMERLVKR